MTTDARMVAAAGIGIPLNAFDPGAPVCTLNRARRKAPHATKRKAAAQPTLSKGDSTHLNIIMLGATPNATRSESESSSMPNLVDVFVRRAIHPSRPSKILAITIAHAAVK